MFSHPGFAPAGNVLQSRASSVFPLQVNVTPSVHRARIFQNTGSRYQGFYKENVQLYSCVTRTAHLVRRKKQLLASVKEETITTESPISESINSELSALDEYFEKLQRKIQTSSVSEPTSTVKAASITTNGAESPNNATSSSAVPTSPSKDELRKVEEYFERLTGGTNQDITPKSIDIQEAQEATEIDRDIENLLKEISPNLQLVSSVDSDLDVEPDESMDSLNSDSYVVYVIAAVNIAVYLFGLASPIDTPGVGTSTMPVLYGAKVNELILNGEWWRLITPMFLHSGFLHIALSSWSLLFFGPQVENVFGPLAFCMIYFLGGLCGNTFSYVFTPDATVGGTGPLFALFSAWVAYLWQNRSVIGEESADYGIKATTLMGVLVLCLSCLLPTDEWIHVGAIFPGFLFGAFSCPILQVLDINDSNIENMEDGQRRKKAYAVYDSPSPFTLILVFLICTAMCFGALNLYGPVLSEFQLLESVPF